MYRKQPKVKTLAQNWPFVLTQQGPIVSTLTKLLFLAEVTYPGEGYSREFLVGVCHPVPQMLILFQTKKWHFPHPFSDLAFRQKIMSSFLRLECKQKVLQIRFESHIFLSFLFGINTLDKCVHTHPQFSRKPHPIPDQNGQNLSRYRTKKA